MTLTGTLFLILGVSAWLAVMGCTLVLTTAPRLLRITGRLVCTKGEKLVVHIFRQGGSNGISIRCQGEDTDRDVKWPSLFLLFAIFFLASLLPVAAAVLLLRLPQPGL